MLLIDPLKNLTDAEAPDLEVVRRRTHAGQASWAVGPRRCFECVYWTQTGFSLSSKARTCSKYSELMNRKRGPRVPAGAFACKFFAAGGSR
jgi:hypothetical protein